MARVLDIYSKFEKSGLQKSYIQNEISGLFCPAVFFDYLFSCKEKKKAYSCKCFIFLSGYCSIDNNEINTGICFTLTIADEPLLLSLPQIPEIRPAREFL